MLPLDRVVVYGGGAAGARPPEAEGGRVRVTGEVYDSFLVKEGFEARDGFEAMEGVRAGEVDPLALRAFCSSLATSSASGSYVAKRDY